MLLEEYYCCCLNDEEEPRVLCFCPRSSNRALSRFHTSYIDVINVDDEEVVAAVVGCLDMGVVVDSEGLFDL